MYALAVVAALAANITPLPASQTPTNTATAGDVGVDAAAMPAPVFPASAGCPLGDGPGAIGTLTRGPVDESLVVSDGAGTLTLRFSLTNTGAGPATWHETVALPANMAVLEDALVGKARGVIADPADARALFDAYADALEHGVPAEEAKDGVHAPALLVADSGGNVDVSVAAPCSARTVAVTLTIAVASLPVDGAWQLQIPALEGTLSVSDARHRKLRVSVDGRRLRTASTPLAGDGESAYVTVVAEPLFGAKLRARGDAHVYTPIAPIAPPTTTGAAPEDAVPRVVDPVVVARAELDLPKPLTDAPAGLRLVFVVDASVSTGDDGLAKEWQILDEILDAAPSDAAYAVVAMSRKSKVIVPPWRDRGDRERPALEVSNGSDVVGAMKRAYGVAADVSSDEVSRVIVLSDMRVPFAVDDPALVESFVDHYGDALAHVVVVPEHSGIDTPLNWTRSFGDEDPRAAAPEHTGGIWVELGGGDDVEAALAPHLIHPTRVDRPRVTWGGGDLLTTAGLIVKSIAPSPVDDAARVTADTGLPELLVEGSGLRVEAAFPAPDGRANDLAAPQIRGLLWSTPFAPRVTVEHRLRGLAAVDELATSLDDDIVRSVATLAHVVSRTTSIVSVPTWRPQRIEEVGLSLSGCGCGCGCGGGGGTYGATSHCGGSLNLEEQHILDELLADDARACRVPRADLAVEVGDHEILAVDGASAGACVIERFWTHRLDRIVVERGVNAANFRAHATFHIAFDGAADADALLGVPR